MAYRICGKRERRCHTRFEEYLKQQVRVSAFIKGAPGDGKTYLAATASSIWEVFYIDVEGGLFSAAPVVQSDHLEVEYIQEPDAKRFFQKVGDAISKAEGLVAQKKINCIVFDSLTELAGKMEGDYAQQSANGKVEFGEWYQLLDRLKRMVRRLKDIPCNVIVTAITKPRGAEASEKIFEPILPGNAAATIPSFFDVVGLMRKVTEKGKSKYVFSTSGPSLYQVRDRYRALDADEPVADDAPWRVWEKLQKAVENMSGVKDLLVTTDPQVDIPPTEPAAPAATPEPVAAGGSKKKK